MPFNIDSGDGGYINFIRKAESVITEQIKKGNKYFISGMAQGADMILAKLVTKLKKSFDGVYLECALPFLHQSENWSAEQKKDYDEILSESDKITVLSDIYCKKAYIDRNKYMVDASGIIIAVYDGKQGGTRQTLRYAEKKGRQIIIINPKDGTITETGCLIALNNG